jgi:hypothetical protein
MHSISCISIWWWRRLWRWRNWISEECDPVRVELFTRQLKILCSTSNMQWRRLHANKARQEYRSANNWPSPMPARRTVHVLYHVGQFQVASLPEKRPRIGRLVNWREVDRPAATEWTSRRPSALHCIVSDRNDWLWTFAFVLITRNKTFQSTEKDYVFLGAFLHLKLSWRLQRFSDRITSRCVHDMSWTPNNDYGEVIVFNWIDESMQMFKVIAYSMTS